MWIQTILKHRSQDESVILNKYNPLNFNVQFFVVIAGIWQHSLYKHVFKRHNSGSYKYSPRSSRLLNKKADKMLWLLVIIKVFTTILQVHYSKFMVTAVNAASKQVFVFVLSVTMNFVHDNECM